MARTVNFNFAGGGGITVLRGKVSMAPTEMRTQGTTIILPSGEPVELIDGVASIPDIEPTTGSWKYQVKVEDRAGLTHLFIVDVPAGTTPINFSALPKVEMFTLPVAATGVQLTTWIQSIRSAAVSANANGVAALSSAASAHSRLDALAPGGGGGGGGIPTGGTAGQILAKSSSADYAVQWINPPSGGGSVSIPFKLVQSDPLRPVLEIHGRLGEPHQTTNSNLVEFRNGVPSDGDPTVGRLVTYINEEGLLRVQNSLNNKTIFRIRNWGTSTNAIQVTNDTGSQILFNVRADDGFVTAPNIGEPIRGILAAGEQPAPGMPEGIYLRRLS